MFSPFFVLRSLLYPFVLGKSTIIQIVVALSVPFLAVFVFAFRRILFRKDQLITWAIFAYTLVLILTSITGISSWQSFWGTSDRSLGVFSILHILTAYFIFLAALQGENLRRRMILFAILIGLGAAILGVFEYFRTGGSRVMGLFGNPILFANYLLFPLFLVLIFFNRKVFWKRFIFLAIFITILFSFFFAQSRGALAGAIAGGIFAMAIIVWNSPNKRMSVFLKIAGIISVAIILIFILAKSGNHTARSLMGRFTQISLKDASSDQRFRLSVVAFKAAEERPIFGWGPENFDYAFDRNYDPVLLKYGVSETWVDRSHNTYLDMLVMNGILGFASYILIFIAAFITLYRSVIKKIRNEYEAGMLGALIIAYGVANFFAFDSLPSFIYFMFILASISAPSLKYEDKHIEIKTGVSYIVLASGILVALISIIFTLRNARAAFHLLRFEALPPAAASQSLAEMNQVIKINPPLIRDFRLRFANAAFEDAGAMPKEEAKVILASAISEMEKNVRAAPADFSYRFALGNLFLERGMLFDAEDYARAEKVYGEAALYAPQRQSLYFQLGSINFLQKDFREAIKILDKAVSFDPSLGQPHWRLGIGYAYNGEVEQALKEWRKALWSGPEPEIVYFKTRSGAGDVKINNINFAPNIKAEREFVLNISLRERDFDIFRVLTILLIGDVTGEAKGGLYAKLAAAELEAENFNGARAALRRTVEYDPSAQSEAEMFLGEISAREKAIDAKK